MELFFNGSVIETFGDVNVMEQVRLLGNIGILGLTKYSLGSWTYGGVNCTDGSTSSQSSNCPYPICSEKLLSASKLIMYYFRSQYCKYL